MTTEVLFPITLRHQSSAVRRNPEENGPTITRRSNLLFLLIRNIRLPRYSMVPVDATNLICWERAPAVQCTRPRPSFGADIGLQWDAALPENIVKYFFWELFSLSLSLSSSFISTTHGMLRVLFLLYKSLVVYLLMAYWYLSCSRHRHHVKVKDRASKVIFETKRRNYFFIIIILFFLYYKFTVSVLLVVPDCCCNLY